MPTEHRAAMTPREKFEQWRKQYSYGYINTVSHEDAFEAGYNLGLQEAAEKEKENAKDTREVGK